MRSNHVRAMMEKCTGFMLIHDDETHILRTETLKSPEPARF
jgi:hypothetical protein